LAGSLAAHHARKLARDGEAKAGPAAALRGRCVSAWRRELVKRHEVPFVKKAAMKAAGELLSRPAAYRAVIVAADVALAHLPRFVIYNRLDAWGKPEVPHSPKQTFPAGITPTAETSDERPRRNFRIDPAEDGAAAPNRSIV
jgi:hypothetical protein